MMERETLLRVIGTCVIGFKKKKKRKTMGAPYTPMIPLSIVLATLAVAVAWVKRDSRYRTRDGKETL